MRLVQVCPREVRLLADDAAQQVVSLGDVLPGGSGADDEELVVQAADVTGRFVLLRLSDGTAVVLHLASGEARTPFIQRTPSSAPLSFSDFFAEGPVLDVAFGRIAPG